MNRKRIGVALSGRFGNNLFQYAFARSYAELHNCELEVPDWDGTKIFVSDDKKLDERELVQRHTSAVEDWFGETDIIIHGCPMRQKHLIYDWNDTRRWFGNFSEPASDLLERIPELPCVSHLRHGDFIGLPDFIAVSAESSMLHPENENYRAVSEHDALVFDHEMAMNLPFLTDFLFLMKARVLFRANSTFSWWAAILGDHEKVFAPNLEGIAPEKGCVQDVPFVEGNYPSISKVHDCCTDLYLRHYEHNT